MPNEFESRVASVDAASLRATAVDVLQLNVGLRCNMRCTHCHQSSSPDRTEVMTDRVFAAALELARRLRPRLVDVTGGAPELHPRIREMVSAARGEDIAVQVRTNLTALLEPGCEDLPELFARLGVGLLASVPSTEPAAVARQRGGAAFDASICVLRKLNALGYGSGSGLRLDLAASPDGATIPDRLDVLEARFRRELADRYGVGFDSLFVITNMPVGRFGAGLAASGERDAYLDALRAAFNPDAAPRLACRTTLVVAWDGRLYDCDFNLGAGLPIRGERTVFGSWEALGIRPIAFGMHCFACTARAGSS